MINYSGFILNEVLVTFIYLCILESSTLHKIIVGVYTLGEGEKRHFLALFNILFFVVFNRTPTISSIGGKSRSITTNHG